MSNNSMTYKLLPGLFGEPSQTVLQIETGKMIPFQSSNTDYQEYLAWLAEGNTPLPADTPEVTP